MNMGLEKNLGNFSGNNLMMTNNNCENISNFSENINLPSNSNNNNNNLNNNSNLYLYEILKILGEVILENFSSQNYEEEHYKIIPLLLKNIVLLFMKIEKPQEIHNKTKVFRTPINIIKSILIRCPLTITNEAIKIRIWKIQNVIF